MNIRRTLRIAMMALTPLLLPLLAMQWTDEVNWSLADFVVMGAMLLLAALSGDFVLRKTSGRRSRYLLLAAIAAIFLLLWAEMAVGIFGSPIAGS